MLEAKLILLLLIANGCPVLARWMLQDRLSRPLDGGILLPDHRPVFGNSKTLRGIVVSIGVTSVAAWLLGIAFATGLTLAAGAMLGDLASSFIKRRMGIPPSGIAPGLDQIPESLLPLLILKPVLDLGWMQIVVIITGFIVLDYLLSYIFYKLRIRRHPY